MRVITVPDEMMPAGWPLRVGCAWIGDASQAMPALPDAATASLLREAAREERDERDRVAAAEERAESVAFQAAQAGHPGPRDVREILAAAEARITAGEQAQAMREALGADPWREAGPEVLGGPPHRSAALDTERAWVAPARRNAADPAMRTAIDALHARDLQRAADLARAEFERVQTLAARAEANRLAQAQAVGDRAANTPYGRGRRGRR